MSEVVARVVVLLVILGVFGFAGANALSTQHDASVSATQPLQDVHNETFQPENDTVIRLSKTSPERVFLDNETVRQDGVVVDEDGRYYNWRPRDGSLYIYNNTWFNTSEQANITYHYRNPSRTQGALFGIAAIPFSALDALLIGVAALALIGALAAVLGGSR